MGAWGTGIFENDDALDWAAELESAEDLSILEDALAMALEADEYVEGPDASVALCAAEVISALRERGPEEMPDVAYEFVEKLEGVGMTSITKKAIKAVRKIKESSELRDLWSESGDLNEWLEVISDLEIRLS